MTPIGLELRRIGSALQFLTVLPVPDPGWEDGRMARAARWFPLAGLLAGAAAAAAHWAVSLAAPPLAAPAALAVLVAVTGALHEDGLADTADGLGGRTRERALEIMKDSRTGAYGVLALVFSVLLRWQALAATTAPVAALLVAPAAGRAMMAPVAAALPCTRPGGTGALVEGIGGRDALAALALGLAIALAAGGAAGLLAFVLAGGAAAAVALLLHRRFGGYTGDGLGAVAQAAEIAALAAFAAMAWDR